jgi:hypothetical protein
VSQRPIAVLDIDGVLADVRHRLHFIENAARDWDGFFGAMPDDPPLVEGVAVARRLGLDHDLVYLTGRPERTRAATAAWLAFHELPRGQLIMRSDRDRRPARVTKPALLRRLANSGRTIAAVVDDDPAVASALEAAGWPVLLADWQARPASLDEAQERRGRT